MRITADRDACDGHGMWEAMAHEFFELADDGFVRVLDENPAEEHRELVYSAVQSCPVAALRWTTDTPRHAAPVPRAEPGRRRMQGTVRQVPSSASDTLAQVGSEGGS